MNEQLPDIELECQNKSHEGFVFIFKGGEQKFYTSKGLNPPTLCPACREERKNQQDITITCEACGYVRTIRKEYIISYRRNEGPWENPTLCIACEKNPDRAHAHRNMRLGMQRMDDFLKHNAPPPYDEEIDDEGKLRNEIDYIYQMMLIQAGSAAVKQHLLDIIQGRQNPLIKVPTLVDANIYAQITIHPKSNVSVLEHIMKDHFEDFEEHLKATSVQDAFYELQEIAESTDPRRVIEFIQEANTFQNTPERKVRYDTFTQMVVVLEQNESPPPPRRIHTAFHADKGPKHVFNKLNNTNPRMHTWRI